MYNDYLIPISIEKRGIVNTREVTDVQLNVRCVFYLILRLFLRSVTKVRVLPSHVRYIEREFLLSIHPIT